MAWLSGWNYRKQITVSSALVDDSLSDFPLTIPVSRTGVESHHGHADGDDIRFTSSDGTTLLSHIWDGWCDDGHAGAYVGMPAIDATDGATIYMYYGNASASDASDPASVLADYAIFWPARNWTSGQLELANNLAVVSGGGTATGQSDGVRIGTTWGPLIGENQSLPTLLEGKSGFTVSCLAKDFSFEDGTYLSIFLTDSSSSALFCNGSFIKTTGSSSWAFCFYSENINTGFDSGLPATGSQSMHWAFRHQLQYGANTAKLDVLFDNVSKVSYSRSDTATSYGAITSSHALEIGGNVITPTVVPFTVAEFRVLKEAASDAWLKFEYANLRTAGNQLTFAAEERLATGPYEVAMLDTFQTDIQQAETYIPGIVAGHTHGI